MTVKDIKEYIIDFENSDKFIDESNICYVIATKKPTVDDLIKIDSIKDFMNDYGFNVITNIEEVKKVIHGITKTVMILISYITVLLNILGCLETIH